MSSTSTRLGRPPGLTPEALEKGRRYLELTSRYGVPVATIAETDGVAPSHVWELLKKVRAEASEQASVAPSETRPQPQPPRRLSRHTVLRRAWDFAENRPTMTLGVAENDFWFRVLVAIHEDGDGFRLHIGEDGCRFRARDDLASLVRDGHFCAGDNIDVVGWLSKLIGRGRLLDIGGIDIGIPLGLGLTPGENARGKLIGSKPRPEAGAQPPLRFPFQVVQGSLSDSGEIPPSDSGKSRLSPESDSGKTPPPTPVKSPISPESQRPAPVTVTSTITKENQSLSGSGSDDNRAERTPVKVAADSGESHPADSGKSASLTHFAEELAALAGLPVPVAPRGLGYVHSWLERDGCTRELLLDVFRSVMARKHRPPVPDWSYFDKAVRDALTAAKTSPPSAATTAPPSPKPSPPRSEADLALDARLEALTRRRAEAPDGPQIPLREAFDAACRAWKPADALRWIGAVEGLLAAGLLADVDLPEFHDYVARPNRFEDQMIQAEEALTAPDTS